MGMRDVVSHQPRCAPPPAARLAVSCRTTPNMTQAGGAAELSCFERERLENIRRNNVVLEGMGIPGLVPPELRAAQASRASTAGNRRKRSAAPPEAADAGDRRRSARLANAPAVVYTTFEENEDLGDAGGSGEYRARPAANGRSEQRDDGEAAAPPVVAPRGVTAPAAAGSSKAVRACVSAMQTGWLGKLLLPEDGSGAYKAAAMARLRGSATAPKFNKYSGIIEFLDAVALCVNVRSAKASSSYTNIFLDGGRRMTWFAQPTQDQDTPVVQRLLACSSSDCAEPVVLFIREEGAAYVYAGKLRCHQYFPSSSPLKIVWELLDFEVRSEAALCRAREPLTTCMRNRRCKPSPTLWSW